MLHQQSTGRAGDGLIHPLPVAAIAVLLLNDHWWKHAMGGPITGKLSDIAGLAFFPLLLQAVWELASKGARRSVQPSRAPLLVAVAMTGIVFALVKTWPPAAEAYRVGLAWLQWPGHALLATIRGLSLPPVGRVALAMDMTDLVALPALGLALWAGWRRTPPSYSAPVE